MKLWDAARSEEARVRRVILAVTIKDAAQIKRSQAEAGWLASYSWFFDVAQDIIEKKPTGKILKFVTEGLLAIFESTAAADAINAGIELQEEVKRSFEQYRLSCSVGIATGRVVQFDDPKNADEMDYIGEVVDRAVELSRNAAGKALWIDSDTQFSASMPQVSSQVGRAVDREPEEYLGDLQKVDVPTFDKPLRYYSILWDQSREGVDSSSVTRSVDEKPVTSERPVTSRPQTPRSLGRFEYWVPDRNIGKVVSEDGSEYYTDGRYLVAGEPPPLGTKVWFVPLPAHTQGKNPIAACVIGINQTVEGHVQNLRHDKGFGFIDVEDSLGNSQTLLWYYGRTPPSLEAGYMVEFAVGQNQRGPTAEEVRPLEDEE